MTNVAYRVFQVVDWKKSSAVLEIRNAAPTKSITFHPGGTGDVPELASPSKTALGMAVTGVAWQAMHAISRVVVRGASAGQCQVGAKASIATAT